MVDFNYLVCDSVEKFKERVVSGQHWELGLPKSHKTQRARGGWIYFSSRMTKSSLHIPQNIWTRTRRVEDQWVRDVPIVPFKRAFWEVTSRYILNCEFKTSSSHLYCSLTLWEALPRCLEDF